MYCSPIDINGIDNKTIDENSIEYKILDLLDSSKEKIVNLDHINKELKKITKLDHDGNKDLKHLIKRIDHDSSLISKASDIIDRASLQIFGNMDDNYIQLTIFFTAKNAYKMIQTLEEDLFKYINDIKSLTNSFDLKNYLNNVLNCLNNRNMIEFENNLKPEDISEVISKYS